MAVKKRIVEVVKPLNEKKRIFMNAQLIQSRVSAAIDVVRQICSIGNLPYQDKILNVICVEASNDLANSIENYVANAGATLFDTETSSSQVLPGLSRHVFPCGNGKVGAGIAPLLNDTVHDFVNQHDVSYRSDGAAIDEVQIDLDSPDLLNEEHARNQLMNGVKDKDFISQYNKATKVDRDQLIETLHVKQQPAVKSTSKRSRSKAKALNKNTEVKITRKASNNAQQSKRRRNNSGTKR